MKPKTIAKRLRKRSELLRSMAKYFQPGDEVSAERAKLVADVLAELVEVFTPKRKKKA